MFEFVKFIQQMLAPMPLFFELVLVAAVLYLFRKKIAAKAILAVSLALLLFFSYDAGQNLLARPLENTFPVCNPLEHPNIKYVVVLGGGRHPDSDRPVSAKLSKTTLTRLVEGIRVFNLSNAENLILTGSDFTQHLSIAALMKECAIDLGVDEARIITLDYARNTREEAEHAAEFVRGDTIFLVSSAAHLKRAAKNFEREGIFVVPVPTDFQTQYPAKKSLGAFFPHPNRLTNTGNSIHEYLGLFYEIFRR